MKKLILASALVPIMAAASAIVTIDGVEIDAARVEITTKQESVPVPNPVPDPVPVPTDDNVAIQYSINWSEPGPRRIINVPNGVILSYPFQTSTNPSDSGSISVSEVAGFESVNRKIWISTSAGGSPLHPAYRCSAEGVSAQNIKWANEDNRFRCSLRQGRSYYFNVTNTYGCDGLCSAYLSFLSN